jgi:hypothetical protein
MQHNLLSHFFQQELMDAAQTGRIDVIDAVTESLRVRAAYRFHTEESLPKRVFLHEPRGQYVGTFITPAPVRI